MPVGHIYTLNRIILFTDKPTKIIAQASTDLVLRTVRHESRVLLFLIFSGLCAEA